MENILHEFNEKITSLTSKYLKNLILDKGIAEFTEDLVKEFAVLGTKMTELVIGYAEEEIFKLKDRKEQFESLEIDNRTIVSIFGEIRYKRRYYKNKETNRKVYLTDEFLGIRQKERLLDNVKERLLNEAIESSYEKAGEKAAYGVKISKQEVKNQIEELDLDSTLYEENMEKKLVKELYIIADEDHVHLQKGGISEPRVVIVYENAISNGKRIELSNKRHFGGVYSNRIDDLWDEVSRYIECNYDTEYLEKVYIQGDGASWIKTGLEWITNGVYILDKFHMTKAINGIVGRITKENGKEVELYKKRLYDAIKSLDFEEFKDICYEILSEEMQGSLRKRKEKLMNYILNNIDGITNLYRNSEKLHGCSAEGHISHILSARMSSRPMGWKIRNVNNMSKLRLLREDNISVKEILDKQKKVIKLEEYKEIKEKVKKKLNKNINFNPVALPIMKYGKYEQQAVFRKILNNRAI